MYEAGYYATGRHLRLSLVLEGSNGTQHRKEATLPPSIDGIQGHDNLKFAIALCPTTLPTIDLDVHEQNVILVQESSIWSKFTKGQ